MFIRSIKSKTQKPYIPVHTIILTSIYSTLTLIKNLFKSEIAQPAVARCDTEKQNAIKSVPLFAVAVAAMLFVSCQKEKLNEDALNSTTSGATSEARIKLPFRSGVGNVTGGPIINYGALIGAPTAVGSLNFQLNVADQLGISCIRARTLVPAMGITPILNTDYEVVLNFNTADYDGSPMAYPTNTEKYRQDLENILASYTVMPVVAVIENEECNKIYTTSTPEEYLALLNTALSVMHSHGIKVANGGLTYVGLNYLVYQDYMNRGMEEEAEDFRKRTGVIPNAQFSQERGAVYETLLDAYSKNDLDYVNFHWKGSSTDTQSMGEVIDYLKRRTGKPVITNELGQTDNNPKIVSTHVQKCADAALPYILWYSPDENENRSAVSLQYNNASLTPSGVEYQDYLSNN